MERVSILIALLLSGCANFEDRTQNMYRLDTIYCYGQGFMAYSELSTKTVFVCKDGRRFMVEVD